MPQQLYAEHGKALYMFWCQIQEKQAFGALAALYCQAPGHTLSSCVGKEHN